VVDVDQNATVPTTNAAAAESKSTIQEECPVEQSATGLLDHNNKEVSSGLVESYSVATADTSIITEAMSYEIDPIDVVNNMESNSAADAAAAGGMRTVVVDVSTMVLDLEPLSSSIQSSSVTVDDSTVAVRNNTGLSSESYRTTESLPGVNERNLLLEVDKDHFPNGSKVVEKVNEDTDDDIDINVNSNTISDKLPITLQGVRSSQDCTKT
jgi:hypothetical protein